MKNKKPHTTSHNEFSTPENYFNNNKEDILKTLGLENSKSKNEDLGFSTPKEYHADFKENLLQSITSEAPKEVPVYSLRNKYLKYSLAIAASFLLFFVLSTNFNSSENKSQIVTIVTDTVQEIKEQFPKGFSLIEENEDLLALYIEDNDSDELLDEYATEDLFFSN